LVVRRNTDDTLRGDALMSFHGDVMEGLNSFIAMKNAFKPDPRSDYYEYLLDHQQGADKDAADRMRAEGQQPPPGMAPRQGLLSRVFGGSTQPAIQTTQTPVVAPPDQSGQTYQQGGAIRDDRLLKPQTAPGLLEAPIGRGRASVGANYDLSDRYGVVEGGYEHPVGRNTTLGIQGNIGKDLGPEGAGARPNWGVGVRGRVNFQEGGAVDEPTPPRGQPYQAIALNPADDPNLGPLPPKNASDVDVIRHKMNENLAAAGRAMEALKRMGESRPGFQSSPNLGGSPTEPTPASPVQQGVPTSTPGQATPQPPPVGVPQPGPSVTAPSQVPPPDTQPPSFQAPALGVPPTALQAPPEAGPAPAPVGGGGGQGAIRTEAPGQRTSAFDPRTDVIDPQTGATAPRQMDARGQPIMPGPPANIAEGAKAQFNNAVDGGVHFARWISRAGEDHPHSERDRIALQSGVGAMPVAVAQNVVQHWSNGGQLSPPQAMMRYMVYKYQALAARGQTAAANQMAFEVLQRANLEAAQHGDQAVMQMQNGDMAGAANSLRMGHSWTPDGKQMAISRDGQSFMMIDEHTQQPTTRPMHLTEKAILAGALSLRDGTAMWNHLAGRAALVGKQQDKDAEGRKLRNVNTALRGEILRKKLAGGGAGGGGSSDIVNRFTQLMSGKPPARPAPKRGSSDEDAGVMSEENVPVEPAESAEQ
jgi:hypothetical protein